MSNVIKQFKKFYPIALCGAIFTLLFILSFRALMWAVNTFLSDVFNSMASLFLGAPVFILIILASLFTAITASLLILVKNNINNKVYLLLFGGVLALEADLAINFALPAAQYYIPEVVMVFVSALIFLIIESLHHLRMSLRIVSMIALVIIGGLAIYTQESAGSLRAQITELRNAGYTIYIPPVSNNTLKVSHVTSIDYRYDGYSKGVNVQLVTKDAAANTINMLFESKANKDLPINTCGNGYLEISERALGDYTCTLVADEHGVKVYMKERVSYWPYYDRYDVLKAYFAIINGTVIRTQDSYEYQVDKNNTVVQDDTPQHAKEIEDAKALLLSLVPASDTQLNEFIRNK
jgi:hypothetical protein